MQHVVIKFLWLQEHGTKMTHVHLRRTFGAAAVSVPTVKQWVRHFMEGSILRRDKPRFSRPLAILRDVLTKFLLNYPLASAKMRAKHFDISGRS
jgi:hypothetical protein